MRTLKSREELIMLRGYDFLKVKKYGYPNHEYAPIIDRDDHKELPQTHVPRWQKGEEEKYKKSYSENSKTYFYKKQQEDEVPAFDIEGGCSGDYSEENDAADFGDFGEKSSSTKEWDNNENNDMTNEVFGTEMKKPPFTAEDSDSFKERNKESSVRKASSSCPKKKHSKFTSKSTNLEEDISKTVSRNDPDEPGEKAQKSEKNVENKNSGQKIKPKSNPDNKRNEKIQKQILSDFAGAKKDRQGDDEHDATRVLSRKNLETENDNEDVLW